MQLKQKTLELQLSDLKLQQHEEILKQEQSQMKLYSEQVAQLLATEKNLRLQLTSDGEKFQQFQVGPFSPHCIQCVAIALVLSYFLYNLDRLPEFLQNYY